MESPSFDLSHLNSNHFPNPISRDGDTRKRKKDIVGHVTNDSETRTRKNSKDETPSE